MHHALLCKHDLFLVPCGLIHSCRSIFNLFFSVPNLIFFPQARHKSLCQSVKFLEEREWRTSSFLVVGKNPSLIPEPFARINGWCEGGVIIFQVNPWMTWRVWEKKGIEWEFEQEKGGKEQIKGEMKTRSYFLTAAAGAERERKLAWSCEGWGAGFLCHARG